MCVMRSSASLVDHLLDEQAIDLSSQAVLVLDIEGRGKEALAPVSDALARYFEVRWLTSGSPANDRLVMPLDKSRHDTWLRLISGAQVRIADSDPALRQAAGLGKLEKRHLKHLGRFSRLPPRIAGFVGWVAESKLLGSGGPRSEALRAFGTVTGDRKSLQCLRGSVYEELERVCLKALNAQPSATEALLHSVDPLFVVTLLKPRHPVFCEMALACQRSGHVLLTIHPEAHDLSGRGKLFHRQALVVATVPALAAAFEHQGIPPGRIKRLQDNASLATSIDAHFVETLYSHAKYFKMQHANAQRVSISHAYSAEKILQSYCDLERPPVIPAYWIHGWHPHAHARHPAIVATHKRLGEAIGQDTAQRIEVEKKSVVQWVARLDEAELLNQHGYENVDVVGLPFAYLSDHVEVRHAGSLLVMPPHGYQKGLTQERLERDYVDYISSISGRFSRVVALIAAGDHWSGIWSHAFKRLDIDVLIGADPSDPQTLTRLKRIFSSFEFMTTNGFGSHIAYAASCGAKVSIAGPQPSVHPASIESSQVWQIYPELRDLLAQISLPESLREPYPFLFVEPWNAKDVTAWARHEIGRQHRLSPSDMKALLEYRFKKPGFSVTERTR